MVKISARMRQDLINYYKNQKLLIVGLNDSQGVNTTSLFFRKGLLDYMASMLTSSDLIPDVINAFSLTMNKTEHIDYFLRHNLSVEEIKLSQVYSAVSALTKVMTDVSLPRFLGQIGNLYKLVYPVKSGDRDIKIATSLKEAYEPLLVYSSGVNNIMREVGANPFGIKSDYKNRNVKPNYDYTCRKICDYHTLENVMNSIERNFYNILCLNDKADIYALGAYIPKSLRGEGLDLFREYIGMYNECLWALCFKYGINYVDTVDIGNNYNNSENNFHISTTGHNALANYILECVYKKKFGESVTRNIEFGDFFFDSKGVYGVLDDLLNDCEHSKSLAQNSVGYAQKRGFDIAFEHSREAQIFEKVLSKTR